MRIDRTLMMVVAGLAALLCLAACGGGDPVDEAVPVVSCAASKDACR